jgi:hypothetical protein
MKIRRDYPWGLFGGGGGGHLFELIFQKIFLIKKREEKKTKEPRGPCNP